MRTSYDSINVGSLPPGADLYLGYDDGHWPDADAIAARFPGKTVVRVTVFPSDNEGDMLDVENGDARPQDAPGWVQRRREAGHQGPLVYCSEALRQAVINAFSGTGVALPGFFIAAYPGAGPVLQRPGDVGHQYDDNGGGGAYDISVVVDYLPGIDPAPTTPTDNFPSPPPDTGDDMFPPNPSEPQFFATCRFIWYSFRKDLPSVGWFNLMWTLWNLNQGEAGPFGATGFGKDWDLVVANIHDTAGTNLR